VNRPGIDEIDVGSYLDGGIADFRVISIGGNGVRVDGAPAHDADELYEHDVLCRDDAFEIARRAGFIGPIPIPVSYQSWLSFEVETVLVKHDGQGHVTHIASYDYGRACFFPGEPRTKPCSMCGVETLIDNDV
jgi:hypothetical protein